MLRNCESRQIDELMQMLEVESPELNSYLKSVWLQKLHIPEKVQIEDLMKEPDYQVKVTK